MPTVGIGQVVFQVDGSHVKLLSKEGHGPRYVEIAFNLLFHYCDYSNLLGCQGQAYGSTTHLGMGPRAMIWG